MGKYFNKTAQNLGWFSNPSPDINTVNKKIESSSKSNINSNINTAALTAASKQYKINPISMDLYRSTGNMYGGTGQNFWTQSPQIAEVYSQSGWLRDNSQNPPLPYRNAPIFKMKVPYSTYQGTKLSDIYSKHGNAFISNSVFNDDLIDLYSPTRPFKSAAEQTNPTNHSGDYSNENFVPKNKFGKVTPVHNFIGDNIIDNTKYKINSWLDKKINGKPLNVGTQSTLYTGLINPSSFGGKVSPKLRVDSKIGTRQEFSQARLMPKDIIYKGINQFSKGLGSVAWFTQMINAGKGMSEGKSPYLKYSPPTKSNGTTYRYGHTADAEEKRVSQDRWDENKKQWVSEPLGAEST